MRYNNYHKHTTYSSIFTPDTHIQPIEYLKRAKELGHNTYFTTEHGFGGDIFETVSLSQQEEFQGIKPIFALEGYIVPNPLEKDNSNYHIMLIARTDNARKKLNKINSRANREGYYYKPRIFLEDLLQLDKDDIYITSACVAGFLRDEIGFKEIFLPLYRHFDKSLLLETQSHNENIQKKHNQNILRIAKEYDLKIIHANDSHYIYPDEAKHRLEYLKGKGITYGEEDNFILDYPDYETIIERYKKQGILNEKQTQQALENTLLFDDCETIKLDNTIKMPNIYPDLTPQERYNKLENIVYNNWKQEKKNIDESKHGEYEDAIRFELDIIKETNEEIHTADYFLLNERIVDIAVNKYNGILTKSGRGSGVSFFINKLLGFTGVDRLGLNVPMYPTRFLSKTRLLESQSLPDFDFNTANPEPFIKATKDLLGENGCYWMIAYGTMKESEAFRNTCRNMELDHKEYNEIAKNIDTYKDDKKWKDIIKHSEKFVGSIVSASPHPCANVLLDKDIEEEIGVVRIGDKLCAIITSKEADEWKYLKNDYLTVLVVEIINDVFKLIGKDIIPISELISKLDDKVWDLYKNGITCTLNQVDSDFATNLIKKYAPTCYEEISAFVAAIRPGFASLLDTFINRQKYSTGVEALDEILETTEHYMLYQESVMQYLVWLGIPEDITYEIVKKIAKKTLTEEEIEELHNKLLYQWIEKNGSEDGFLESWEVIENNSRYSFNASHSISVALDSLYGAYLKANYPLEYYKVVLDKYRNDLDRTTKLISELPYFNIKLSPIKFRHSGANYTIDKPTNTIYKGVASIKHLNHEVAEQLYELRNNTYNNFYELMLDIKNKVNIRSNQLDILIKLDYFEEFGKAKKLLDYVLYFNSLYDTKVVSKNKFDDTTNDIIAKYSRQTEKQFRDLDNEKILLDIWNRIPNEDLSILEKIDAQKEYLGYVDYANPELDKRYVLVMNLDTRFSPRFNAYCLNNGKTEQIKVYKEPRGRRMNNVTYYSDIPFKEGDILFCKKFNLKPQSRKTENGWEQIPNTKEWWLLDFSVITENEMLLKDGCNK